MAHRFARVTLGASLLILVYSAAWVCCGCGAKTYRDMLLAPEPAPNLNATLSFVSRFGLCHGCPIAPDLALVAAHCIDHRPFDATVPAYGSRYSNADGTVTGVTNPLAISSREDLGVVELVPPVGGFYRLALEEPRLGEPVWWLGFDYRSKRNALKPRPTRGELTYTVAGNIVLGTKGEEGASGGCVLNAEGEVIGIVDWGIAVGINESVAIGVGVWGDWPTELIAKARQRQAEMNQPEPTLEEVLNAIGDQP